MSKTAIPNMVVGFSRARIRVPKAALRMIGCPRYIRMLINTDERYVAISPGKEADSLSYRVPDYAYSTGASFEICSLNLIEQIRQYCDYGPAQTACQLTARACLDERFVIFSFPRSGCMEVG